jgi:hypothetical protein
MKMPETLLNSTDVQSQEVPKTVLGLEEKYQEENKKVEDKTIRAENISESLVDSLPESIWLEIISITIYT